MQCPVLGRGQSELASVPLTVTTAIAVLTIISSGACVTSLLPSLSLVLVLDPRAAPWLEQVNVINLSRCSEGTDSLEQTGPQATNSLSQRPWWAKGTGSTAVAFWKGLSLSVVLLAEVRSGQLPGQPEGTGEVDMGEAQPTPG